MDYSAFNNDGDSDCCSVEEEMPMKKKVLTVVFVLAPLLLVFGTQLVSVGEANPYFFFEQVPPDEYTKPPVISVFSPANNTVICKDNVHLSFSVDVGESETALSAGLLIVRYKTDWVNNLDVFRPWMNLPFSHEVNLTGIPEGKHNITIHAIERGEYTGARAFNIDSNETVFFTIDTTPPNISVLTPENKTYDTSNVMLNFTVDESVSQITYSLDKQGNVTITGNTTLTGLSDGPHTLTVYAKDIAGNTGISETITFNTRKPFSATLVVAYLASVIATCLGLLVCFKTIKKKQGKPKSNRVPLMDTAACASCSPSNCSHLQTETSRMQSREGIK